MGDQEDGEVTASAALPRARDPGIDVRIPKDTCTDAKCPFHGHLKVHGQVIDGTVVSAKMQGTIVVMRTILHYVPKYERYEKRKRRYMVHSPPCLKVTEGKRVRFAETRSLAKTVSFVVVENLGDAALQVKGDEEAHT